MSFRISCKKFTFKTSYKECLLTKSDAIEEIIPANIKWKIKECLSVISKTMIADVNGALVIPVKKATIPAKTTTLVSLFDKSITPEITEPILAPAVRAGAKIPPAPPEVNDKAVPHHS